jgi:hypothetical protein
MRECCDPRDVAAVRRRRLFWFGAAIALVGVIAVVQVC